MKRYEPTLPRAAFGVAAAAMTALTMGLLVLGPAQLPSGTSRSDRVAAHRTDTPAPAERAGVEVAREPLRIDVIAHRDQRERPDWFGTARSTLAERERS
jgi:hypothetical protein